jgi:Predicted transcriptional regulator
VLFNTACTYSIAEGDHAMPKTTDRIIRLPELSEMIGLSRSTIYDKLNINSKRYDSDFPQAIKLGLSAVGWRQSAVNKWLENRSKNSTEGY